MVHLGAAPTCVRRPPIILCGEAFRSVRDEQSKAFAVICWGQGHSIYTENPPPAWGQGHSIYTENPPPCLGPRRRQRRTT